MKSNFLHFFSYRFFVLAFVFGFLIMPIFSIIDPEGTTVSYNGRIVETNFENLLPFLIIGLIAALIYAWMGFNCFRVRLDYKGILVKYWFRKELIPWGNIEFLTPLIGPLERGSYYKLKPKGRKRILFRTDRWKTNRSMIFGKTEPTQMEQFIIQKKKEFGI